MRRVVITGMGTINACGLNVKEYWENIKNGKSGITRATNIDLGNSPSQVAGEVKNERFNPEDYIDKKLVKRMDRFCHFAFVATKEALEDSKLLEGNINREKVGVNIASGIGGIYAFYENVLKFANGGNKKVSPLFIPMIITDISPGYIAIEYGLKGPNYSVSSACASASHAISLAYNHIINGDADVMITGGSEAALSPLGFAGFTQAQALSTSYNDTPEKASRPFDRDRDGFVMA